MPQRDLVAVSIPVPASWLPSVFRAGLRAQCQPTASLHRPEPTEPPGPDDPDEDDDAPPDPDRMPGEPIPLPIGDPPPVHAPQSAVSPHDVSQLDVLVTKPANFLPAIYLAGF